MINAKVLEKTITLSARGDIVNRLKTFPTQLRLVYAGKSTNPKNALKFDVWNLEPAEAVVDPALEQENEELVKEVTKLKGELTKKDKEVKALQVEVKKLNAELDKAFDAGFQPDSE